MMVNGKIISKKEMGLGKESIMIHILENGNQVAQMVMEYMFGGMVINMKGNCLPD